MARQYKPKPRTEQGRVSLDYEGVYLGESEEVSRSLSDSEMSTLRDLTQSSGESIEDLLSDKPHLVLKVLGGN